MKHPRLSWPWKPRFAKPAPVVRRVLQLAELEERVLYSAAPASGAGLLPENPDATDVASADADSVGFSDLLSDLGLFPNNNATATSDADHTTTDATLQESGDVDTQLMTAPDDVAAGSVRHELVFVDANIAHHEQLLESLGLLDDPSRLIEVVVLSPDQDGIAQISAALAERHDLDAIHVLSHGTDGAVKLGATWLNLGNLEGYAGAIAQWHEALSSDADILLYGCDLAASTEGRTLVESLSTLTGADVAASTDNTGHALYHGNWDLEYQVGRIESAVVINSTAQQEWIDLMAIVTVNTTSDASDGTTTSIAALIASPGADGVISLREAIAAANSTAGTDTIAFNIAGAGPHTINLTSALPLITGAVVIDGTTDPDFAGTPIIELNGTSAGAGIHGLQLDTGSSGSTIRGLVINRFGGRGIYITNGSGSNLITGNYLGTDVTGLLDFGNGTWGIDIINGGSGTTIGGNTSTLRNVISGNNLGGIALSGASVTNTVIQGNYIGVGADGATALGNTGGYSVLLLGGPTNAMIGGTGAGEGNIIANNSSDGVEVWAGGTARILGNSIYGNAGLGIDLTGDGITPNDAAPDSDSGANNLQNFPALTAATTTGGTTDITGSLTSALNTTYRVEFFATSSTLADATNGEGRLYLGFVNVTTNGSGVGTINTTLNLAVNNGDRISATATNLTTNTTSEFAANITATAPTTQVVVDTTRDVSDGDTSSIANLLANRGADGLISLREAIAAANATAGANFIRFDIPGNGAHTINLTSALPTITDAVTVDGSSSPDFTGTPVIVLDGNNLAGNGLTLANGSDGSTIRGVVIRDFGSDAIEIQAGSDGNTIVGNYLGRLTVGGIDAGATEANGGYGLDVYGANNIIGGTTAADRNVISGNGAYGVHFTGVVATGNTLQGNYIGTTATGATALGNTQDGVVLDFSANGNTIGGTAAGAGNVISGNGSVGLSLTGVSNSLVQGNLIGTNAAGTGALGNVQHGVILNSSSTNNTIGGTTAAARNVISGNSQRGIYIGGATVTGNLIEGNYIGTNAAGTAALGNASNGIEIDSASSNTIGGTTAGARNVIAGNSGAAVRIINETADSNSVLGNYLGTNALGTAAIANVDGVRIEGGADNNTIGGTAAGAGNLISGNSGHGIEITGSGTTGNSVQGNFIGTNAAGTGAIANVSDGISLDAGTTSNQIGGTVAGAGNTIAYNGVGVALQSSTTLSNSILGNAIYSNTGLAIDLNLNGITANDTNDVDTGSNNLQNFPVLTSAETTGSQVMISGTLNSEVSKTYRIEFFANTANASAGQRYLGFVNATTPGSGPFTVSFTADLTVSVSSGEYITATATDPSNNTSEFSATVQARSNRGLWMSNIANNTLAGGLSWNDSTIVQFGDPNLAFEPGTSAGTFNGIGFDLDSFASDGAVNLNGIHYVSRTITVGSAHAVTLQAGDLLLSTATSETLGGVAVASFDIILFHPNVSRDYRSGTFSVLLQNPLGATATRDFALVETATVVGGVTLQAGDFLLTAQNAAYRSKITRFQVSDVGIGTSGTISTLIDGASAGIGIGSQIFGVELIQASTTLGGKTLTAGQLLLTLDAADTVGTNNLNVTQYDIFTLTVTATGVGSSSGSAALLVQGSDVGLSAANEEYDAIALLGLNTAPELDATKSPALTAINEDAGVPSGAVGTLVSTLVDFATPAGQVDNVTDVDSGALLGIAVTAADTSIGSWFYSTNNGGAWTALGAVSDSSARLLAADANSRLYFQPNANDNGTLASAITFRAWDQSSGSNGSLADASSNGDASPFSTATDTASLVVNAVNDAPVITSNGGGATASISVAENSTAVTTVTSSDVDGGVPVYSISGGVDLAKFTINSSSGALSFVTAPNYELPTDFGGNNVYDVIVQVSDGSLTDTQAIAVTVTNITEAGITVSAISGNTTEASGTATFTVVLDVAPTASVSIGISSSDSTEGTVSTSSLLFTTGNWNVAQTVTVTGVDDTFIDGNIAYTIVTAPASSTDTDYNNFNANDVSVTNTDLDTFNTLIVDTTSDVADGTTSSIAALMANKGADGKISLREAILATNATANGAGGADRISFNIPDPLVGGAHTIVVSAGGLPTISDAVIIDGTTEPDYAGTPIVELNGGSAGANADGLRLNSSSSGSTIRGLVINRFDFSAINLNNSDNNVIAGNFLGTNVAGTGALGNAWYGVSLYGGSSGNLIGGTTAADRNLISGQNGGHLGASAIILDGVGTTGNIVAGNYIGTTVTGGAALANHHGVIVASGADGNTIGGTATGAGNVIAASTYEGIILYSPTTTGNLVQGNFIGTNAAGTAALGNMVGVQITGANNTVGGTTAAARNIISGNSAYGVEVSGASATGNLIAGNYIGLNASGTSALANFIGVEIDSSAASNTVGGTSVGARNVISGNSSEAIRIAAASNNAVQGNYIGTNAAGTVVLGNGYGVTIDTGNNNTIGGTAAGAGNVIAGNGFANVDILSGTGNAILSNSIYNSSGLGIDLGNNGLTANDAGDSDSGANGLQNFPVLFTANSSGGNTTITGTLNSTASTTYRIELFSNAAGTEDATGYGEGRTYLGFVNVTTDINGDATINTTLTVTVAAGDRVTATATDPSNNTSEFAMNVIATSNTFAPVITSNGGGATASINVAENSTTVTTVTATDADLPTQTLAFSISGGADMGRFTINSSSGVLSFASGRDRESPSDANLNGIYEVTVSVSDGNGDTDTQDISVTVTDVDEFDVGAVSDTNATANSVNENAANGTVVNITAFASDADATTNAITYSLTDAAGGRFTIDSSTGVVTVADGTLLNREAAASHNITVRAASADTSFSDATFTINLNDVDEFDVGAVNDTNGTANSVNENAANGTVVNITAFASDADATTNAITYSLTDAAGGRFTIDSATGIVTVADGTLLNREAAASHNITVRATSGDTSFSDATFTINLNDVDEFDVGAVSDTNATANSVNENAANGMVVNITAFASDADATTNTITYSLDNSAGGRFAIDSATGVVTVAGSLDYETATSHSITVRATSADTSFSTQSFTINVNPLNDNNPVITSNGGGATAAINVAENSTAVTTVIATDSDLPSQTLSYAINGGADAAKFSIDSVTGTLTFVTSPNFELPTDADSNNVYEVTVRVSDGSGGTDSQDLSVTVTDGNEAPVLDNSGAMWLTTITEDDIANNGNTVASIIASAGGNRITDVDAGAVEGIAVTGLTSGNGSWEFSTDGGGSWNLIGGVSDASALLLRDTDRLRFVPNGQNGTSGSVSFRAWDQTSGSAGNQVDASANGGTTAFSTATETAWISVSSVNDAPVLDNSGSMTLTTLTEDATNNGGNTVFAIIGSAGGDRITDVDVFPFEGMAITSLASGNGTWQFSIDGGFAWSDIDPVSDSSALLLRETDKVRFVPDGQNATAASFTFRAWDEASGAPGNKVDASVNGGSTAFSTASETASITVTGVNDAPTLSAPANITVVEDVASPLIGISFADVDSSSGNVQVTFTPASGSLGATSGGGVTVSVTPTDLILTGSVTNIDAFIAAGNLTFTTAPDDISPVTLNFTIDDLGNTGAGGALSASGSVSLLVTPVNDAPVATDDSYSANEDFSLGVLPVAGLLANDTDIDGDSLTATLVSGPTHGTLTLDRNGSFAYDPDPDFFGTDTFTYQANDGLLNSNVATVTITVNEINDAPVANDDTAATNEDAPVSGNVLTNDTDIDNTDGILGNEDTHTAVLDAGPSSGALIFNNDGSFTYTPNANYFGTDSFTYHAVDSDGASSNVATMTITVNEVNDAPVANADSATTNEDMPVSGNVLTNDTDIDNTDGILGNEDTHTTVLNAGPSNGSLILLPNGGFTYTPNANFFGTDTFTYHAVDSDGAPSNVATVTITVNEINDAPVANDDSATTNEDTPVSGNVLTNDTDIDNTDGILGNEDTSTAVLDTGVSNGALIFNADGSFTYTPNANFFGSDSFTYHAVDSDGAPSNVATVAITVGEINDTPIANEDTATTNEDTPVSGNVLTNDTDIDNTDGILGNEDTHTAVLDAGPSNGSLLLNPDGSFTYTPNANFFGTDSFTYHAVDSDGAASNIAAVSLTVNEINDAPVANDDSSVTNEDTAVSGNVLTNDTDIDNTDGIPGNEDTYTAVLDAGPSNGALVFNGDGSFTYSPNANFFGADSFTYHAVDSDGAPSNVATVTITVNEINDAPVANDDAASTNEDTPVSGNVLTNDTDIDNTDGILGNEDTHTAVLDAGPSNGSLLLSADGSFTYMANANFFGVDSFVYHAVDSDGAVSNVATVTITVNEVNDAPVANDDTAATSEDTPVSGNVLTNDTDIDNADGIVGNEDTHMAVLNANVTNGSLVFNADGTFTYSPNANFFGTDSFTYHAVDSDGAPSNVATVTITVNEINDAPVANDDSATTNEDMPVSGNVLTNDTDIDNMDGIPGNEDTHIAVLDAGPSNGSLLLNADGSFTYTPNANFFGVDSFIYHAVDSDGAVSNVATVTISVNEVNDAPVATSDSATTNEDTPVSGNVLTNDTDIDNTDGILGNEDTHTAVLNAGPSNGSLILNSDGTFTYTPNANFFGTDSFMYHAVDSDGAPSNVATVTITVNEINDAPFANNDAATTNEDTPVSGNVLTNDTDADNTDGILGNEDTSIAVLNAGPAHGSLTLNADGGFTYTPDANFNGSDSFTYHAVDSDGATSNVATVNLTITSVNDAPVATSDNVTADQNTTLTISAPGILGNDTDIEGDVLQTVLVAGPANGTLTLAPDGSFVYTPNPTFTGKDCFSYRTFDGQDNSNTVLVTITVQAIGTGINPPPPTPTPMPTTVPPGVDPAPVVPPVIALPPNSTPASPSGNGNSGPSPITPLIPTRAIIDEPVLLAQGPSDLSSSSWLRLGLYGQPSSITEEVVPVEEVEAASNVPAPLAFQVGWLSTNHADQQREESQRQLGANELAVGATVTVVSAFSVGYALWTLRGGYLLTSFIAALPAWQMIDPLPVLQSFGAKSDDDDDEDENTDREGGSLLSMVRQPNVSGMALATGVLPPAQGAGHQISFLAPQTTPESNSTSPLQATSHPIRDAKNEI